LNIISLKIWTIIAGSVSIVRKDLHVVERAMREEGVRYWRIAKEISLGSESNLFDGVDEDVRSNLVNGVCSMVFGGDGHTFG